MSDSFLVERLAQKKAMLAKYEATLTNALESNASAHSLDTGQTRQSITTHSIGQLQAAITRLESEIVRLEVLICKSAASQGRPVW